MALEFSCDLGKTQFSSFQIGERFVFEECTDNIMDGIGDCWDFSFELKNSHDERIESISEDVVDLLPSDPFGMDIRATFTAITGWIEEFEKDIELSTLGFVMDKAEEKTGDDCFFSGLNLVWNGAMRFNPEANDTKLDEKLGVSETDNELRHGLCEEYLLSNVTELLSSFDEYQILENSINGCQGYMEDFCDGSDNGDAPHDALFFALGHFGVKDLLSVERVCKSLRDSVRNDPLLWRNIQIDIPLNERISDDTLLGLTSRAQGSLQCLSLVECRKITDSGLKIVLENNPRLMKLSVPGCSRLSVEGIVHNLKVFKSGGGPGIKNLRIGGILGVTKKNFEELKSLLDVENNKQQLTACKPRFFGGGQFYLSFDDDRAIDIETCSRCLQLRQVYDCPAENCQGKDRAMCKACTFCIARCINCGCCMKGRDYEETFCLNLLCMDCRKQFNCEASLEGADIYLNGSIFHHKGTFFCFYG